MSDIRYDRLHDSHVIIAPERLHRPECFSSEKSVESAAKVCPFCEGNESMTPPEIFAIRKEDSFPNKAGWQTRVVPNLYKAVQIEAEPVHHFGLFEHWGGFGAHEIIIDTPEHYTSMTEWSEEAVQNWLKTLGTRVSDLRRDKRIAYISLFKNEGREAGATQEHSHTQLIGLPFIPKDARELFERSATHYKDNTQALLESELTREEDADERVVSKNGDFTAYCPYASAYPFEMIITSKSTLGQIDTLSDSAIAQVAPLLLSTLQSLKKQLGYLAFNLSISTPPLQEESAGYDILSHTDKMCRFAIRIMPRLYHLAGFELSTGMMINPVLPEQAAKLLRESIDG